MSAQIHPVRAACIAELRAWRSERRRMGDLVAVRIIETAIARLLRGASQSEAVAERQLVDSQ